MEAYPSDSLLGSVVDRRYRVDERVGAGAFGCVYAAWHLSLNVRVALKVLTLDADLGDSERGELVARFLNEGRVLTRLKHTNIVAALDLGTVLLGDEPSQVPYLAMEWCDGKTLAAVLAERGPLSLPDAYDIIEPLADALGHAHAAGVVHRDVKPSNVMLTAVAGRPCPRLVDFGIAKQAALRDACNTESVTVGAPPYTAAYAAPEQAAGARSSPATDVHAVGLLLIELITGSPPYGNGADPALAIIDAQRPSAGPRAGAFHEVIARAVALKPSDRYADGRALRDALRDAARRELGEAHPVPSARPAERRQLAPALLLVGAVIATGLVALAVWRTEPAPVLEGTASVAVARPTFCELTESDQRARLERTALATIGFEPGWAFLYGADDHLVTIEWTRTRPAAEVLSDAATDIGEIESLGLAYAVDNDCLVFARGPRSELLVNLDAVLADETTTVRGDTVGGPDPLAVKQPRAQWQGPRATGLSDLSQHEYAARAETAGMLIHDSNRSHKKNGDWQQLRFKYGEALGRVEYISGPYARAQLLGKLGKAEGVVYYAIDEPVAILAYGLTDPAPLKQMLSDLGAAVEKSPP